MLFKSWCLPNLRIKCFIIGYLNLVACVIDVTYQLLIAFIVSNGFQCDVDYRIVQLINWPWLETVLLVVNIGTNSLYPLPLIPRAYVADVEYMPIPGEPRCYPGTLHINLFDIMYFLINVMLWKFFANYISALYRKDPEPMHRFCNVSMVKLMFQLLYVIYTPNFHNKLPLEAYCLIKLLDVCITGYFLYLINTYTRALEMEREAEENDQPPSSMKVDKLMASQIAIQDEKKDVVLSIVSVLEEKPIEGTKDIV